MDTLFSLIQLHTDLMDRILIVTKRLFRAAKDNDIDNIEFESLNRERLINIIENVQMTIEEKLNSIFDESIKRELTPILNAWANDLGLWYETIGRIDDETTQGLEQFREETAREIAATYKGKESMKGYNLNQLK